MKLERQPSNLIDSFAQTEHSRPDSLIIATTTAGIASNDMVDSGVGSQHNKLSSTGKEEQNPSTMDDDEDISLTDDRFRPRNLSEGEEEDESKLQQTQMKDEDDDDDDKKDDEVSVWSCH